MSAIGQVEVFLGRETIIASSAMKRVMTQVQRVAQTNAFVLVCGETGTGKEHVARAIHQCSLRRAQPWVDVNCGALPEHLVESELFGHERGAFSGADSAKPGLFELAQSGSIFLDEVAELNPVMQVKLLRVLDGTPYYRLGGVKKIAVDVRVIAATNRDLEQATREGKFRRDLYYRLNEFSIQVPPLRERPDDIMPIAEFFLRQWSDDAGFSEECQAVMRAWSWPGNIRELRNVVTTATILSESREIEPSCLPACMRESDSSTRLEQCERRAIMEALNTTEGHQQHAAEMLGISRRTLSRKLKQYRADSVGEACIS
ncbi:MAG: sigma-54 dependent transcriptional regulator [Bryobacteraceae bacterium]